MLLCLPLMVVDVNGAVSFQDGALFSLPPELCDNYRLQKYQELKIPGWNRSEYGYYALLREDELGNRYIVPGLALVDGDKPAKKFPDHKAIFTKEQVSRYLDRHISWIAEVREKSDLELTALVHDLRHLSTSIYHSALEAEKAISRQDRGKSLEDIKTVIASQTMLRVRIDYLDFASSINRKLDDEKIPVYSRVDKVIRCFRASAKHRGIQINLIGESYRLAYGQNILDIVPYTLIENAINYSPRNQEVEVEVTDVDGKTTVTVRSLGPALEEGEMQDIFKRGYRGSNAARFRTSGTGLGLAVANSVIELFSGHIEVAQSESVIVIDGLGFKKTEFIFSVPTAGEDATRKARYRSRVERVSRRHRLALTS